jgi:hypothetical protein
MPARSSFDYAIIRVVPLVERGEFINAGVVVFCRTRRFLDARIELDRRRLAALAPGHVDPDDIQRLLDHIPLVCAGGKAAGPIGELPQTERFHWIVAPRSTIIQTSPVHSGFSADPAEALDHLMATMVRLPDAVTTGTAAPSPPGSSAPAPGTPSQNPPSRSR